MIKTLLFIILFFSFPTFSNLSILDENKARAYLSIAETFFVKIKNDPNGNYKKVNYYIQKALKISPNNFLLNYRFAIYLKYQKEYKKSLRYFNKSLKMNSHHYLMHYDLSNFFLNQENPFFDIEKAIFHAKISLSFLKKKILLNSEEEEDIVAKLFNILAQAFYHKKNLEKAFIYTLDAIKVVQNKNFKQTLEEQAKKYANIKN